MTKGVGDIAITVLRTPPLERPAKVTLYAYSPDGSARQGDDYAYFEQYRPLDFAAGEASQTITFTVLPYKAGRPAVSTLYFDLSNAITATLDLARWRQVVTILNQPPDAITGLAAQSSSPTLVGGTTYLTATIIGGAGVTYTWALGDGSQAEGKTVTHIYPAAGNYTARVTAMNVISTVQASTLVQVVKRSQTITFPPIANHTISDGAFLLVAGSSSGLAVSFSSVTPTVCTVSGTTVTLLAQGTCTITALQSGNDTYEAAQSVDRSFTISGPAATSTPTPMTSPTATPVGGVTATPTPVGGATATPIPTPAANPARSLFLPLTRR